MRITCFLIFFLTLSTNVGAQDSVNQFFDKDYAKNPLEQHRKSNQDLRRSKSTGKQVDLGLTTQSIKTKVEKSKEKYLLKNNIELPKDKNEQQGLPISSLGLIISAADTEYFQQLITQFSSIVKKQDLDVSEVFIIGSDAKIINDPILASLIPYGAIISIDNQLPEQYSSVTHSPTYIITTSNGQYLLEGIDNFEVFINSAGEFIEEPIIAPEIKPQALKPAAGEF